MVKGILVHRTTAAFAGRRQNVDLGRSSTVGCGLPPLLTDAPVTAGVLWSPRKGTTSAYALNAYALCVRASSLLRSSDGVLHSVQRPVHVDRHYTPRRKSSEVARSSRYRGRANLRKREEPAPGLERTDVVRLVVGHRSRKRGRVAHRRKGRRSRPSSLRGSRARVWLLVRRNAVAEVSRRRLVSNTLGTRAPKRAVRVE